MPTSWASLLMALAFALAISGAPAAVVAAVGAVAFLIEVIFDVAAVRGRDER